MRYVLRVAGLLAVVFALYVIVGEQLVGSSGDAYVNTRLASVSSPADGVVQLSIGPTGGRIAAHETLGTVTPIRSDVLGLLGVEQARAIFAADLNAQNLAPVGEPQQLLEGRIAALDQLAEEKRAQILASQASALRSGVSGIIWSVPAHQGDYVAAGDPIANIADCNAPFIHASVDQRLYNRLSVGDVAQFRFHDGPALDATVALLAGTGPRTLLETLAISPTARLLQGYSVILSAPGLTEGNACPLGRTGRVVFSAGPLSGFGDWLAGLGF
jgi:multidrug resistance efflux pump